MMICRTVATFESIKKKEEKSFFNSMPFFILALIGLLVLWYVLSLY